MCNLFSVLVAFTFVCIILLKCYLSILSALQGVWIFLRITSAKEVLFFLSLSVCLSVCQQLHVKTIDRISMKILSET